MDEEQIFQSPTGQCTVVVHQDIVEAETIEPKKCPVCEAKIKLYQIHFNEAFLMCGNINCIYPFGIADFHIYKIECNSEFVPSEYRSMGSASVTTCSSLSQSDWSELDKLLPNNEHLYSPRSISPQSRDKSYDVEKIKNIKMSKEKEEQIKKDVKKITELNRELFELDDYDSINNTKWLHSLAKMQERSGVKILKRNELQKVNTTIPDIGGGELKIDIDSSRNVISVQIENQNSETK